MAIRATQTQDKIKKAEKTNEAYDKNTKAAEREYKTSSKVWGHIKDIFMTPINLIIYLVQKITYLLMPKEYRTRIDARTALDLDNRIKSETRSNAFTENKKMEILKHIDKAKEETKQAVSQKKTYEKELKTLKNRPEKEVAKERKEYAKKIEKLKEKINDYPKKYIESLEKNGAKTKEDKSVLGLLNECRQKQAELDKLDPKFYEDKIKECDKTIKNEEKVLVKVLSDLSRLCHQTGKTFNINLQDGGFLQFSKSFKDVEIKYANAPQLDENGKLTYTLSTAIGGYSYTAEGEWRNGLEKSNNIGMVLNVINNHGNIDTERDAIIPEAVIQRTNDYTEVLLDPVTGKPQIATEITNEPQIEPQPKDNRPIEDVFEQVAKDIEAEKAAAQNSRDNRENEPNLTVDDLQKLDEKKDEPKTTDDKTQERRTPKKEQSTLDKSQNTKSEKKSETQIYSSEKTETNTKYNKPKNPLAPSKSKTSYTTEQTTYSEDSSGVKKTHRSTTHDEER